MLPLVERPRTRASIDDVKHPHLTVHPDDAVGAHAGSGGGGEDVVAKGAMWEH